MNTESSIIWFCLMWLSTCLCQNHYLDEISTTFKAFSYSNSVIEVTEQNHAGDTHTAVYRQWETPRHSSCNVRLTSIFRQWSIWKRFCLRRTETCSAFGVLRECAIQIYFYLLTYLLTVKIQVAISPIHSSTTTIILKCSVVHKGPDRSGVIKKDRRWDSRVNIHRQGWRRNN